MKTVWKIGSRWSDNGRCGTSIFEKVFLPYGVVFAYKDCTAIKEGDLIAIADGYDIIAIAKAETPGVRMGRLDRDKYGDLYAKYFSDAHVFGCKVQMRILDESDGFEYKKMGMFFKAGVEVSSRINKLANKYFSPHIEDVAIPSLFDWANKELAQDSFLCWMLECANSTQYDRGRCGERRVGFAFLQQLLKRAGAPMPTEADSVVVRVYKQVFQVDVAASISFRDVRIGILIEDKVGAAVYNDIESYCARIKTLEDFKGVEVYPVIVRTGDESNVEKGKVPYYLREDFLSLFRSNSRDVRNSQLLLDFYRHISAVETEIKSYERLPLSKWSWDSWKGFYAALQRDGRVAQTHWNAVSGNGRGFLCAYPSWDYENAYIRGGMVMYWQFESDREYLALKVMEVGEKRKEIRDMLISAIDLFLKNNPEWLDTGVQKVARRGVGYSMTIKTVPAKGWYVEKEGRIDLDGVVKRVSRINAFRNAFVKSLFDEKQYKGDVILSLLGQAPD